MTRPQLVMEPIKSRYHKLICTANDLLLHLFQRRGRICQIPLILPPNLISYWIFCLRALTIMCFGASAEQFRLIIKALQETAILRNVNHSWNAWRKKIGYLN